MKGKEKIALAKTLGLWARQFSFIGQRPLVEGGTVVGVILCGRRAGGGFSSLVVSWAAPKKTAPEFKRTERSWKDTTRARHAWGRHY